MTITPLKTPIIYPEPDGAPMAESDPARKYLSYGADVLELYFEDRPDVYVSGNLWLSYEKGVPDAVVAPDVFVIFGVEKRDRTSYKVWEENGKTPDWVLEITSASTRHRDERDKPETYAQMGVSEYFQYDPTGDYLNPALKGRRLVGGGYKNAIPTELEEGILSFSSQVLGLELRLFPDGRLRFFNPQTGEYLRNLTESERARQRERQRADQAESEADRQRQRANRLAARLRELGIDPEV